LSFFLGRQPQLGGPVGIGGTLSFTILSHYDKSLKHGSFRRRRRRHRERSGTGRERAGFDYVRTTRRVGLSRLLPWSVFPQ
jgi:hypothetical protein